MKLDSLIYNLNINDMIRESSSNKDTNKHIQILVFTLTISESSSNKQINTLIQLEQPNTNSQIWLDSYGMYPYYNPTMFSFHTSWNMMPNLIGRFLQSSIPLF